MECSRNTGCGYPGFGVGGGCMLYIIAIALGVLVGLLKKGSMSNLLSIKIEKAWLILASFLIQFLAQVLSVNGFEFTVRYSLAIQGVAFALLLTGLCFNRKYAGMLVIGGGCILNVLVMMLNGGKMPVSRDVLVNAGLNQALELFATGGDGRHILADQSTKLLILGDIMSPPGILSIMMKIVSIGDIIVVIGLFLLVFEATAGRPLRRKR